ncbi:MAG: ABC transporter permease [Polaromonas sp.]|nr:ABC transporter permease [Polaromonas sp.]
MHLSKPLLMRLVSFGVVLAAWEYGGAIGLSAAFPSFSETFAALWGMILDGSLGKAFAKTLEPLLIGLAISVFFGVILGVLMGLREWAEWVFAPIFIVAQAAPLAALIPILTFAYGIGLTAKVFTVCIMAMPVIVINASSAIRNTPDSLVEMGRSFLGTRQKIIWNIILPSASPMIFVGLRLGVASGFIGIILAELLITPTGIGDLISYNQSIAEYPTMYAAILSIIIASVLFLEGMELIEKKVFRPELRT